MIFEHRPSSTHARPVAPRRCCIPWGISSAGRAPALQAGGRRFDPVILHHQTPHFTLSRKRKRKSSSSWLRFRFDLSEIIDCSFFNNLEEVKFLSFGRQVRRWVVIVLSTNMTSASKDSGVWQRCTLISVASFGLVG
jgi:hypothetical protein